MKKVALILLLALLLTPILAQAISAEDFIVSDDVDDTDKYYFYARLLMADMTLEEKVAQLFMVTPEQLTDGSDYVGSTADYNAALLKHAVGGIMIRGENIVSETQLAALIASLQQAAEENGCFPMFIAAEEEGGYAERIAMKLGLEGTMSLEEIADSGHAEDAYQLGKKLAERLKQYGFNMNLAPVGDARENGADGQVPGRYAGKDPLLAAEITSQILKGMQHDGMIAAMKHFPGEADSAEGITSSFTVMRSRHVIPFEAAIRNGQLAAVCISALPVMAADGEYAMFSSRVCDDLLRGELGFEGVVLTGLLCDTDVTDTYSDGEACIKALLAGCDMLVLPEDFSAAFNGVLQAAKDGTIAETRIDQSVIRILALKIMYGLIE